MTRNAYRKRIVRDGLDPADERDNCERKAARAESKGDGWTRDYYRARAALFDELIRRREADHD